MDNAFQGGSTKVKHPAHSGKLLAAALSNSFNMIDIETDALQVSCEVV